MEPLLLSIGETCRILGVGRSTLYDLIGSGELTTILIGRRRLVRVASIKGLAASDVAAEAS